MTRPADVLAQARRVVLLVMAGQSNGEGRGLPVGPALDPPDPRILMWEWGTGRLATATVPLSSQRRQVGLSPATVAARCLVRDEPPGTVVVILNAAVGASGLVADPPTGTWAVRTTSPHPHLFDALARVVPRVRVAVADAAPAAAVDVGMLWHQGEADGGVATKAYATAFDELVAALRRELHLPGLPVVLGGLVPEAVDRHPELSTVRDALAATPARLSHAAYVDGVRGGGGSAGPDDVFHYSRAGVQALGAAMCQELRLLVDR